MPGGHWSLRRARAAGKRDRLDARRLVCPEEFERSFDDGDVDVERPGLARKRLQYSALHGAPDGRGEFFGYSELRTSARDERSGGTSSEAMIRAAEEEEKRVIELEKGRVKDDILTSRNGHELINKLDQINEDWCAEQNGIPGNIYRSIGFGVLKWKIECKYPDGLKSLTKLVGIAGVAFIQVVGPPAIFLSETLAIGVFESRRLKFEEWHPDLFDWHHIAVTKILAIVALIIFVINALNVLIDEKKAWKQMICIHEYLDDKTEEFHLPGKWMLHIGTVINCWVVFWSNIDALLVIGGSQSPAGVLFNSLSLLFLFNLDDIGGDVALLEDGDWPTYRMDWVYDEMVVKGYDPKKPKGLRDTRHPGMDDGDLMKWGPKTWISGSIINFITIITISFLFILPVLAAITAFSKLKG